MCLIPRSKSELLIKNLIREILNPKIYFVDMSLDDIRAYEKKMHTETNKKVGIESVPPQSPDPSTPSNTPASNTPEEKDK